MTVVQALRNWFGKPIAKLPRELRAVADAYIPQWSSLSAGERRARAEEVDRQRLVKAGIKLARAHREQDRDKRDPLKTAESTVDWFDSRHNMSASYWMNQPVVLPHQVAELLCQLNPLHDNVTPEGHRNEETGRDEYKQLLGYFNALALAQPEHRTFEQWVRIAQNAGLTYHSWIDDYLSAVDTIAVMKEASEERTVPRQRDISSTPAAGLREVSHRLKNRSHPLDSIFAKALAESLDKTDYQSVWAAYVKIAQADNRPAPLLGYAEGEGVKYSSDTAGNGVAFDTKRNFAARFRRLTRLR